MCQNQQDHTYNNDQQPTARLRNILVEEQWADWHHFVQECRACQHELMPHWQLCASCEIRLTTTCPACEHSLPPLGALACRCCGLPIPVMHSPQAMTACERRARW